MGGGEGVWETPCYGLRGEERFSGQRREACSPPQPLTEHTWRRGQSFLRHLPWLKLMHISRWDGASRLGPA